MNVGGSVSFTTAQYLRLFDGVNSANFYANTANDGLVNSVLAVAPVADFGFLSPAAVRVFDRTGSECHDHGPGQRAVRAFWAVDLARRRERRHPSRHASQTKQFNGHSCRRRTERFNWPVLRRPESLRRHSLRRQSFRRCSKRSRTWTARHSPPLDPLLCHGSNPQQFPASIDVSGARTVFVKSGQLVLSVNDATLSTSESPAPQDTIVLSSGKSIMTSNSGIEPGADVQITVGTLQMETENASVETINTGDGTGGNISINASTITATFAGAPLPFVFSSTGMDYSTGEFVGSGNGGNVTVQGLGGPGSPADSVALSLSGIQTVTFGPGRGGNVQLTAGTLTTWRISRLLSRQLLGVALLGVALAGIWS